MTRDQYVRLYGAVWYVHQDANHMLTQITLELKRKKPESLIDSGWNIFRSYNYVMAVVRSIRHGGKAEYGKATRWPMFKGPNAQPDPDPTRNRQELLTRCLEAVHEVLDRTAQFQYQLVRRQEHEPLEWEKTVNKIDNGHCVIQAVSDMVARCTEHDAWVRRRRRFKSPRVLFDHIRNGSHITH